MMSNQPTIGFLGSGKMATAMAGGIVQGGVTKADCVFATDLHSAALEQFCQQTGGTGCSSPAEVLSKAQVIILAVKPHQIAGLLEELAPKLQPEHLLISIAAGVTLGQLQQHSGQHPKLVRVMPNTPALVGSGASGWCKSEGCSSDDAQLVGQLLSSFGVAYEVPEVQLDAVTGVSGSGPAYVFQFIEALSDGGVRAGLPRDVATQLAAQTVMGAAQMVLETGQHPGVLKDAVTSPGGTTITGIQALEQGGLRAAVMNAVVAATERSQQLGR